jgi:hypothetical protein
MRRVYFAACWLLAALVWPWWLSAPYCAVFGFFVGRRWWHERALRRAKIDRLAVEWWKTQIVLQPRFLSITEHWTNSEKSLRTLQLRVEEATAELNRLIKMAKPLARPGEVIAEEDLEPCACGCSQPT